MAPSGGAGITPTLHRLPPRPTPPPSPLLHPHLSSSLPPSYPLNPFPCLALSSWLLFVCLGSLACRCVVCLCVSSSGLFSLCLVCWFFVFLLSSRVIGFLVVCLVCVCVFASWFAVCLCCGVCFISVSVVYGVCVFGWCVCVVSLLFSRVSPVSMCLVGALFVAYCLLSIGLLFFCVLSVVVLGGVLACRCVVLWCCPGCFCVLGLCFWCLFWCGWVGWGVLGGGVPCFLRGAVFQGF